jgi:hypothetical protein
MLFLNTFSWFTWSAIIISLTLLCLSLLLSSAGLFKKVTVTTGVPELGKTYIAYKYYKGEYKNCGKTINEIYSICSTVKCFGIYYDDPKLVS